MKESTTEELSSQDEVRIVELESLESGFEETPPLPRKRNFFHPRQVYTDVKFAARMVFFTVKKRINGK